ncbi:MULTISPECIES: accessory Sec system glycosylation chaperone GtfB [unclassified Granulicatella]|uniref:accessory Sec system glycosylation chaperone GtfB n=1 Tax=unclassified Granulicatella TaxID=2630493 RepID=UPI00142F7E25|nr:MULTISPECIES: accessory Sec system glycosylation chaperone GtfB [unclassified Granulicatella]MBF0780169.1 accessory Sec system glycosylation chaperone GtfB [Granulicatella sp. 19428wC4_WM01]
MICLYQHYNQESQDLHYSLNQIGVNCPVVVIEDNGFLPEHVYSPFRHYTENKKHSGKPLYYNQLKVPDYWEIEGNQHEAKVMDLGVVRAIIRYAFPKHLRLIQTVEWLDMNGKVRSIDRYNQYGWRFAQTIFTSDTKPINTTYYTQDEKEILVENHQVGTLSLNDGQHVRLFANRIEFIHFYLKNAQFNLDKIIYNSLAEPFLVAYYLKETGEDTLVWQENIQNEIPGNMEILLQKNCNRLTRVLVQNKGVYQRLNELMNAEQKEKCQFIGNIYPIKRQNTLTPTILIYTNSDQIEQIEPLIQSLPMYYFNIAALTEMSSHLMALQSYPNVHLFPNVTMANIHKLNTTCDIYLDINHYDEVVSALRTAFEHNMLLFAFSNTVHHKSYINDALIFNPEDVHEMIATLQHIHTNKEEMINLLNAQYTSSDHQSSEDYHRIWEN